MAKVERIDDRLDKLDEITKNSKSYSKAIVAARYFNRALDALQVEFQPNLNDEKANDLYYSLIREYLLEAANDIKDFGYDDDAIG